MKLALSAAKRRSHIIASTNPPPGGHAVDGGDDRLAHPQQVAEQGGQVVGIAAGVAATEVALGRTGEVTGVEAGAEAAARARDDDGHDPSVGGRAHRRRRGSPGSSRT